MGNKLLLPLIGAVKEVERERQYNGLKRYVKKLKKRKNLNGKEKFILKGATSYLKRLQADRRACSLGLREFIPYAQKNRYYSRIEVTSKLDFRAWDMCIRMFLICTAPL